MSRNTSMLVVSNRVYAKREEDGALHPGLVESKQEDCYTVKFADETRSAFLEKDLVWIGFWGLPSSCWPEYPVIQTTVLGTVELDDKIRSMANKVTDRESKEPALFTVNEISESDESLSESSSSGSLEDSQSVNKLDYNGAKQLNPIQMCALSERTKSPRPSVLRLNTGLLHKDSPHSHLLSSSPRKGATETVEILPRLSPSIQENLENNDSKFKSKFLIEREDRSCFKNASSFAAERTSHDSKILLTTKSANNSDESLWSLTRREMENQTNTRHLSLNPDAAWYPRDWSEAFPLNRSNLTPSIIPLISAKYFSQEPPLFRELYETLSRKGPLITDNTQLLNEGQKKRKRSDDTKKCRKVYGVDNRHAWCTQCRWKKACARFGD